MESLFNSLKEFFQKVGNKPTFWLAYSGGLDSHVLLHVAAQLRDVYQVNLQAVHIDHGLSPHAKSWALHCEKVCQKLNVTLAIFSIQVKPKNKKSLEDIARRARYKILSDCLKTNDYLLTAHHLEDQAETVMLQLLRGAGTKGLSAMPAVKKLGEGLHVRPFLKIDQKVLRAYAKQYELQWIEDESNVNRDFSRNFLRHEVFPILKKHWPGMTKSLARVACHAATTETLLTSWVEKNFQQIYQPDDGTLNCFLLRKLPREEQALVLRYWIQYKKFSLPSTVKMQTILENFLQARADKNPKIYWGNVELRRYRDGLSLFPRLSSHEATQYFTWDFLQPLELSSLGKLIATKVVGRGFRPDIKVTVRFRNGGERCQLPGRKGRHSLKSLFQTWGVPPWMRDRIPLLYVEDTLAAVIGYYFNEEFLVSRDTYGFEVSFIYS